MVQAPSRAAAPETHRVRVGNRVGGRVEVSLDRGRSYAVIGHVVRPASANADGPPFAGAVRPGTVALVGATRLMVRTDAGRRSPASHARPRVFALQAAVPELSASAARLPNWVIATDVPAGSAIFEALAPPLGSQLFLQTSGGLRRLPEGYVPTRGDLLVFVAEVARALPAALVFENRTGGRVVALDGDGREESLGTVRRPVSGVGRYPATAGVAPGRLAEQYAGSLLVATAGPAAGARGSQHAAGSPVVGQTASRSETVPPRAASGTPLAGSAATLGGFRIETASDAGTADETVLQVDPAETARGALFAWPIPMDATTRVEMRVDDGPWMPLPPVRGLAPDAFGPGLAKLGVPGLGEGDGRLPVRLGITHLRILFGGDPALRRAALAQAARRAAVAAREGAPAAPPTITERSPSPSVAPPSRPSAAAGLYRGKLTITANVTGQGIAYVIFLLDGKVAKITNAPPFTWDWDTRHAPNGEHTLEIRGADEEGNIINQRVSRVRVKN